MEPTRAIAAIEDGRKLGANERERRIHRARYVIGSGDAKRCGRILVRSSDERRKVVEGGS